MDEHYCCLLRFCILFLDIDARPINIKKLSIFADKLVGRYFALRVTGGYQVGKNANEQYESQHYVG